MQNKIDGGYVYLAKSLLTSELWYCSSNTLKVAIYLLIEACFKGDERKGLDRGQCWKTLSIISQDCGISIKAVRCAIDKLKSIDFIVAEWAQRGARQGQVLTVCNYSKFQSVESYTGARQGADQGAGLGHAKGQTKGQHYNEYNKVNEVNERNISAYAPCVELLKNSLLRNGIADFDASGYIKAMKKSGMPPDNICKALDNYIAMPQDELRYHPIIPHNKLIDQLPILFAWVEKPVNNNSQDEYEGGGINWTLMQNAAAMKHD